MCMSCACRTPARTCCKNPELLARGWAKRRVQARIASAVGDHYIRYLLRRLYCRSVILQDVMGIAAAKNVRAASDYFTNAPQR